MTLVSLRRVVVATALFVLAGCPSDDASGDGTDSDGTDASTGASATSPSTSSPTTSSGTTSSTTSETSESTGEVTTGDSSGEDSTTGPMLPGVCLGLDVVGTIGEVSSLEGAMIETTCDVEVAACGGDIVGVWNVESSCGWEVTPNFFADCPGSTMTVTSGVITGTRTFNADMTFMFDTQTSLEMDVAIDSMTCYGVDCATFQAALAGEGLAGTCMDAGDGTCECALSVTTPNMAEGTWATADTALVVTTMEGEAVIEYCVTGERLDMWTAVAEQTLYEEGCADDQDCLDALGNLSEFYVCLLE